MQHLPACAVATAGTAARMRHDVEDLVTRRVPASLARDAAAIEAAIHAAAARVATLQPHAARIRVRLSRP